MKAAAPAKHVIVVAVDNKPGVVSRISGLFTRRGYNIESLVTGVTDRSELYKLVITVISTEEELELLICQLGRIMEVIEVYRDTDRPCVTRELMFIRVNCPAALRSEVIKTADALGLEIAGLGEDTVVVQVIGDDSRLSVALKAFESYGIAETIRSGALTMEL